ncbi:hypothetical protein F5Y17DRAFT_423441 [Xylariaceae sp. FL0594]|nr:hypothetical protein F5Y17DRAFT_423441 [Xylariaceae sp. FL0594]
MMRNPGSMKTTAPAPMTSASAPSVPFTGGGATGWHDDDDDDNDDDNNDANSRDGSVEQQWAGDEEPALPQDGHGAETEESSPAKIRRRRRRIFDGVVVYVNGSTYPVISDYTLKHVLAEHGAKLSSHLSRRKVTHVILGRPSSPAPAPALGGGSGGGCGGGLAAAKLQREIANKKCGPGVKFVGAEWVLESIKAGKRLPEARFADLQIAAKTQARTSFRDRGIIIGEEGRGGGLTAAAALPSNAATGSPSAATEMDDRKATREAVTTTTATATAADTTTNTTTTATTTTATITTITMSTRVHDEDEDIEDAWSLLPPSGQRV